MSETCKSCKHCNGDGYCEAPVPEYIYSGDEMGSSSVVNSIVEYTHECNLFDEGKPGV